MALVTIHVLEGLERGRTFGDLATPVTIGREEDNDIQLNDERISRFHVKIQEDGGRIILTDLDSTNGTRVNGHPTQLRVLQAGDLLSVGRCLLLIGDCGQPSCSSAGRVLAEPSELRPNQTVKLPAPQFDEDGSDSYGLLEPSDPPDVERQELFPHGPPELPDELKPLQRAQLSDLLAFVHEQIGDVLHGAVEQEQGAGVRVVQLDWNRWQHLVRLEARLSLWLRQVSDPDA